MNYLVLAAFVLLCVWFIVDRFYYNERMAKRYLQDAEKMEKIINEYKSYMDKKWDIMLLEAAKNDGSVLMRDFQQGLNASLLNLEFQKAKLEFNKAFKAHQPLRDKVARIINLLQLDNMAYEESAKKSQKHLN